TKCQPIGITDVLAFLIKSLFHEEVYNKSFDIGGSDILTYKDMLLEFGRKRNLKRTIITVPVMTPQLSSYWLYFVTSTSYKLAAALVSSMKVEVICENNRLSEILDIKPLSYRESLDKAFVKIANNQIASSWKDSFISGEMNIKISDFIEVPVYGCFIDKRSKTYNNREDCLTKTWSIGGKSGWYYATWLWKLRGYIDKLFGGVGLRRGRTNENTLTAGDSIDFWRVLYANKKEGKLLLFAEMKLPGEAWLEFKIVNDRLIQTATFRPLGLSGRLYWFLVLPFHGFIFNGMLSKLTE
ncbi:MAG TPA: SDR family oxidoreductase, partial [Gillisia sp.]|nr:SDR family oxidoreductase [Gillisia sp.]